MDFQPILDDIAATLAADRGLHGQVASYIPALARIDARHFGLALTTTEGQSAVAGDGALPFSIQSISKVFTLTLAMQQLGEDLWARIGREPSGDPFNSLVQLEHEQGKPRNPFINAGAIAVADRLVSVFGHRAKAELLALMGGLAGEPIAFDEEVAASEAQTGFRNLALANFMKSFGKLDNPVDAVLDLYFHQCALRMSCVQLARAASYLCRDGAGICTERQTRRINALMLTCGTYDAAGEFAFRIGLPCKSGVGGGIVAVMPDRLTLAVWSPALDATGNSALGMRALELFVARTGLSVF
ncbi:glutaminase [Pseudorhodoferax sp. Leaf267]|uniref:glutaminase n=1 Tax=Pseudorhodoferax sp. Leaf267 TaxID=1736316 RepID=UPI0006F2500D|nr:glutaminase [Pseudorhodoferax sp. Leaf267]KQP21788.1 glutaminase A [Pseudorhodoferax sp. Leaf267]